MDKFALTQHSCHTFPSVGPTMFEAACATNEMPICVDDYSIVDTTYIVHAIPVNSCKRDTHPDWLIGMILHVGHHAFQVAQCYPTQGVRDAAFEKISVLMQRQAVEMDAAAD
jgi:hypothetical protein